MEIVFEGHCLTRHDPPLMVHKWIQIGSVCMHNGLLSKGAWQLVHLFNGVGLVI
jgi:hypothetical protein